MPRRPLLAGLRQAVRDSKPRRFRPDVVVFEWFDPGLRILLSARPYLFYQTPIHQLAQWNFFGDLQPFFRQLHVEVDAFIGNDAVIAKGIDRDIKAFAAWDGVMRR